MCAIQHLPLFFSLLLLVLVFQPGQVEGEDLSCSPVFVDCAKFTILNILYPETSSKNLPNRCKWASDLTIFAQLFDRTELHSHLDDPDLSITLFAADDDSIFTSAGDIRTMLSLDSPLSSNEHAHDIIAKIYPSTFEEPSKVLDTIVLNQVTNSSMPFCELWSTQSWFTLANQHIARGGSNLECDNSSFLHPEMSIQYLPMKTKNGIIHRVDRLIMPDLSMFSSISPSPSDEEMLT